MSEREIILLKREISALKQFKIDGRDMTGLRAQPASNGDVLQGDKIGDYLYVLPNNKYTLVKINGIIKWDLTLLNTGF